MRLRSSLLAGMAFLVAAIVAATVAVAVIVIGRAERAQLSADLARSRRVFEDLLRFRESVLKANCRVIINEPRLRATVATEGVTRETLLVVIDELRASLGSDLFLLTDETGYLLADALAPTAEGYDMTTVNVVATALAKGEAGGIWITNERPHQVQACRIDFDKQPVGVVVIGHAFDDEAAETVHRQTGTALVVSLDGKRVAASKDAVAEPTPGITSNVSVDEAEVEVGDQSYAVVGGILPGYAGQRAMSYAMLRSLDEALAPGKRLARLMLVIAAIGMFAALIFAGLIANSLSKPVNQLVRVTEHIAEGKLATRAPVKGSSEIKTLGRSMNVMIEELEKSRRELAEKGRLEREMEIAMRIQTSILPRTLSVPGLQIAARMKPATEVGGDYYDVIPVEHGCWIGIGDVAGHGLTAGLEMLMVQSIISALVHENPGTYPREVISVLNGVIYDNVRNRIGTDEHVTLTLLRYRAGTITYAGAHEDILVWRADGTYEQIQTPGTWVGAMPKIADVTRDSRFELRPGDLVVLFSDGLTEAMNASREQFGIDRLRDTVAAVRDRSVEEICDHVIAEVEQWQASQDDDLTIVAFRRAVSA